MADALDDLGFNNEVEVPPNLTASYDQLSAILREVSRVAASYYLHLRNDKVPADLAKVLVEAWHEAHVASWSPDE